MKVIVSIKNKVTLLYSSFHFENIAAACENWLTEAGLQYEIILEHPSILGGMDIVVDEEIALVIKLRWGDSDLITINQFTFDEQALSGASLSDD